MNAWSGIRNAAPFLLTLIAGGGLWNWLWGRWFSPGGESLHGCIHLLLVAGCLLALLRRRAAEGVHFPSFSVAALFLLGAALLHNRIPALMIAGLYASALYWAFRSSPAWGREKPGAALWVLLVLSLPIEPSMQFVFGYPLRALAARTAAFLLPGNVEAVGCGLGDGRVEVFVDAPCAGAAMLTSALFLAAGASLAYRLSWLRTGAMLLFGTVCALYANAVRAALLYLGNAGRIAVPLHRYESATGLFCFAASGLLLLVLASLLAKNRDARQPNAENPHTRGKGSRICTAAYNLLCAVVLFLSLFMPAPEATPAAPLEGIVWPATWGNHRLVPCAQSPETEKYWNNFPGVCREFLVVPGDTSGGGCEGVPERVVLRLVTRPTRLLHPAEDCFRGAGYSVAPLPALRDDSDHLWSGFVADRDGRKRIVRQCVIAVNGFDLRETGKTAGARVWPDVSSWYWDVARPGAAISPLALAVTAITADFTLDNNGDEAEGVANLTALINEIEKK